MNTLPVKKSACGYVRDSLISSEVFPEIDTDFDFLVVDDLGLVSFIVFLLLINGILLMTLVFIIGTNVPMIGRACRDGSLDPKVCCVLDSFSVLEVFWTPNIMELEGLTPIALEENIKSWWT